MQHHHAHLAAVLAEHGESGPAVGAIYDGSGYGSDATVWGGELLVGGLEGFERAGHLRPARLPGADRAVREPWRMARARGWRTPRAIRFPAIPGWASSAEWTPGVGGDCAAHRRTGGGSPDHDQRGRLCDAVSAICGLRSAVTYEGQAAIELEALAKSGRAGNVRDSLYGRELEPRPAILAAVADLKVATSAAIVSARFPSGTRRGDRERVRRVAEEAGLSLVVLAGGVFQNRLLLESVCAGLQSAGLRVLTPECLPPNDGAISYGQAAIAAATM